MFKALRHEKGFTLVELMMVIAIIGILAVVLIPKMGFMKDTARESGIDTNMRVVEATATGLISKYTSSEVDDFETALANKLGDNITNPFNQETVVTSVADHTDIDAENASAVIYDDGDDEVVHATDAWGAAYEDWHAIAENMRGAVAFAAYADSGQLKCDIFYYDAKGDICDSKYIKTVD